MSIEPMWLDADLLLALHDDIIAKSGGAPGLRDGGLLESALGRAPNRYFYEGVEDIPTLAATYGQAVAKNHPFVDGNKRAGFQALGQFLTDNGMELVAKTSDATRMMLGVADGSVDLDRFAAWVRDNSAPA